MNGKILEGKIALVTGASRGLGRAMALALGGAGARLALVGRAKEKLAETQAMASAEGIESEVYICDVREEDQIAGLDRQMQGAAVRMASKRAAWSGPGRV